MNNYLCIFFILFFITNFGFSEANLFSLIGLNDFINIEKLEPIDNSWYFYDFEKESKSNLRKINVNLQRKEKNENYTLFYNSRGLLDKEESRVLEDYDYLYLYDEKDRLISCGDFSFKYLDDFQRERYYKGELQYRESLEYQKDKLLITVITYSKRYSDNAMIEFEKRIYEYNFKEGFLSDIYCTRFNRNGIEDKNKSYFKFSYENNFFKTIFKYYGGGNFYVNKILNIKIKS
ncbi:hypothetical protein [uncultured Treponema sp.]|uniref:hypothetical protein n=1 Tax=uncultured Treponema sp. TaxID=162155 RepID=UPI0025F2E3AE|nr:hypothetical protein [uncultured Treponema sp.]